MSPLKVHRDPEHFYDKGEPVTPVEPQRRLTDPVETSLGCHRCPGRVYEAPPTLQGQNHVRQGREVTRCPDRTAGRNGRRQRRPQDADKRGDRFERSA
jgi:hypothetical protein